MADCTSQNLTDGVNIGGGDAVLLPGTSNVEKGVSSSSGVNDVTARESQNTPIPSSISLFKGAVSGIPDDSGCLAVGETAPGSGGADEVTGATALEYNAYSSNNSNNSISNNNSILPGQAGGSDIVQGMTEIEEIDVDAPDITPDILVREVDVGQPCLTCHENCPGFAFHEWRHVCNHCKCRREDHDIYNDGFVSVRDRLGWSRAADSLQDAAAQQDVGSTPGLSKEEALALGYTWVPAGLSANKIHEYMEQLPNDQVPRAGTHGERYRDIQLIRQLPKQDLSDLYCRFLDSDMERKEFQIFRELRDQVAMGIAEVKECQADTTCYSCKGEVDKGELVTVAVKVGAGAVWHPACFTCCQCEEMLVDLVYCQHARQLYCQRHYAELIRPRCPGCDELIFSAEYTKAMEENFHKDHLACKGCDKQLIACRYIVKEEHPYCIPCYQKLFAHNCDECSKPIGPDFKDLSYKERHWHEFCFKCCGCQASLVDQPFASKNEKIYCSDCHDNNFAARCDECGEPFRGGMKKFEYKGKQWHDQCFTCSECSQPIGNKSFIPRDERVICVPCFEAKYAQRCSKCQDVINKGGISYKNTPWHRECFTCNHCQKQLAGEKFTSKEEQPFCGDCYAELFAKRCCRCTKPITGIGGTKFISFEERHWHSGCFNCYTCEASMVGRGFLMNGEDIVCPECGRS